MTVTRNRFIVMIVCAVLILAVTVALTSFSGPYSGSDQYQPYQLSVTMNRYEQGRSGANTQETTLTTSNVNVKQFGKLFTLPVVGDIYAQPLVVSRLLINYSLRTVVYVATMHNMVYAFDANQPGNALLWSVNLGPIYNQNIAPNDITGGEVGVLSTPVIDLSTTTIYVVSHHNGNPPFHMLHALDLITGQEKFGGPVVIQTAVVGKSDNGKDGIVYLDNNWQLQRPGLVLLNGKVFVALGSTGGRFPYHGWLLGYNASNLQETVATWNTTPDGEGGGIWMSGAAPSVDAQGNIYVVTGNGHFNANDGGQDYGDSFIKLDVSQGIKPVDYFTPFNQQLLFDQDADLGTGAPIFIPTTDLMVGGGKKCTLYVVNSKNMGKYQEDNNDQIVQNFCAYNSLKLTSPVTWNSPVGPLVYNWSVNDYLKAYKLSNGKLDTVPLSTSWFSDYGFPTGTLALSSNGTQPGTGILWTVDNSGLFRAVDAMDLTHILWTDKDNIARDSLPTAAKFVAPMIANGRVYVPTRSNMLVVYGLLPQN